MFEKLLKSIQECKTHMEIDELTTDIMATDGLKSSDIVKLCDAVNIRIGELDEVR